MTSTPARALLLGLATIVGLLILVFGPVLEWI